MNKLTIHGLDLGELGIGDVPTPISHHEAEIALAEHFVRQILGSITFGPSPDAQIYEIDYGGDDFDWEYAE